MRGWFKSPLRVRGYRVPGRRFTVWALYYCLVYFVLPVLAIGLSLDVLGYLLFVELLGTSCYGILCLWQ